MLQMINSQTLDPAIDVDSDFSPDGYRRLMEKIRQQGYQFCDLQTAENGHLAASHHIFLRHDIDINLESAFQIACIEFELGIRFYLRPLAILQPVFRHKSSIHPQHTRTGSLHRTACCVRCRRLFFRNAEQRHHYIVRALSICK